MRHLSAALGQLNKRGLGDFGYKTRKSMGKKKLPGRVIAKKRENPAELETLGASPVTPQSQTEERTRGNPLPAAAQAASENSPGANPAESLLSPKSRQCKLLCTGSRPEISALV